MKVCSKCEKPRNDGEFAKRGKGTSSHCKQCQRAYVRDHYQRNKQQYLERNQRSRKKAILWVIEYFKSHPCVDCGETDPIVLEFDHVRGKKIRTISVLLRNGTLPMLKREVEKCVVRCSNCHRRRHFRKAGLKAWAVILMR